MRGEAAGGRAADEKHWVAEYERLVRRGTIVAED